MICGVCGGVCEVKQASQRVCGGEVTNPGRIKSKKGGGGGSRDVRRGFAAVSGRRAALLVGPVAAGESVLEQVGVTEQLRLLTGSGRHRGVEVDRDGALKGHGGGWR